LLSNKTIKRHFFRSLGFFVAGELLMASLVLFSILIGTFLLLRSFCFHNPLFLTIALPSLMDVLRLTKEYI